MLSDFMQNKLGGLEDMTNKGFLLRISFLREYHSLDHFAILLAIHSLFLTSWTTRKEESTSHWFSFASSILTLAVVFQQNDGQPKKREETTKKSMNEKKGKRRE